MEQKFKQGDQVLFKVNVRQAMGDACDTVLAGMQSNITSDSRLTPCTITGVTLHYDLKNELIQVAYDTTAQGRQAYQKDLLSIQEAKAFIADSKEKIRAVMEMVEVIKPL